MPNPNDAIDVAVEARMADNKNVYPWPKSGATDVHTPKPITRPCDWSLISAVQHLETQLGTVEAYNRLCAVAERLRAQIDAGNAKPQNPLYAIDPEGGSPLP